MTTEARFTSVWDAIEATPAEAAAMRLKSDLLQTVAAFLSGGALSEDAARTRLGIAPGQVADLLAGRIDLFDLDTLVRLAVRAGRKVELTISEAAQA